jgi:hypothetical protein
MQVAKSTPKIDDRLILREMVKRQVVCKDKLNKLENRIKILESYKNKPSDRKIELKDFLKQKGLNYKEFFVPMGYYSGAEKVVSADNENKSLTYAKGMNFDPKAGFHIPSRAIVTKDDHSEILKSGSGMKWNPTLKKYTPNAIYNTRYFSSAEGNGDRVIDIMGGLTTDDFARLTNSSEDGVEYINFVQDLIEEEYDNVEGELDLILNSKNELKNRLGFSNADGESDTRKVEKAKNLVCRNTCITKHPFSSSKRKACQEDCDKKYRPSEKQEGRRDEKDERLDARRGFRSDKKKCKDRYEKKEISKSEYQDCLKKERKEKRESIKESGGNLFVRLGRTTAKITPILALARGGVRILVGFNTWGFATRLSPALLPDAQAKELFKPEAIEKAKIGWLKVARGYKNMGGEVDKLKESIIKGYNKKPYKVSKKASFEGDSVYEFSAVAGVDDATVIATAVTTGLGALASLVSAFTKAGGEKNPYKDNKTPEDYKKALGDDTIETNPIADPNAPILNEKGEWVEPSTNRPIDPLTGKYKDTILGVNKWVAIGIGVAGLFGLYYITKKK